MTGSETKAQRLLGQRLMLAFDGFEAPADILEWIKARRPAGLTLFRPRNIESPAQVRVLTERLQAATREMDRPLLIAADQEGGQLNALGDQATHFPGNMALGATGDTRLARRVGQAIGLEMRAMGINVNYAPVSDINSNPDNPNVGARAFGDDPELVGEMSAAMVSGLQSAGVAATAKHFPGNGGSSLDPHFGLPELAHDERRLAEVDFRPFQAAINAGVRLIMSAHVALPELTGRRDLPATLSSQIMTGQLRDKLGFRGLIITDALDMKAISQGAGQLVDVIAAIRAGVDLLMLMGDPERREQIYQGLVLAYARGLVRDEHLLPTEKRLSALRQWLDYHDQEQPDLGLVGCGEHLALAQSVARRSITLVRDKARLLPLNLDQDDRIAVIMPRPADLTPADTSSYVKPVLAEMVRNYHPNVDEFIVSQTPAENDIQALRLQTEVYQLLVIGTTSASMQPEQATLVNALLETGVPAITIALRTPYDLATYPQAKTHICTYTLLPVAMREVAAAMWGGIQFQGRLPVQLKL